MPSPKEAEALTCMSCGTPIKSGFFCARCASGEEPAKKKDDGWKGSRFTGEAKKKKQQALLREELGRWAKRILVLAVIGGIAFGVKAVFGTQIVAWYDKMRGVTTPREKYDPTKDKSADVDDQGQANGTRAFTKAHDQ